MIFRRARDPLPEAQAYPPGEDGFGAPPPESPQPRPRWVQLLPKIAAGVLLLFVVGVASLAITAPLGKALEPVETPAVLPTAPDGTPIARRGSFKAEPVDVTALPDHVGAAFVAIEDQRFYDHIGIDIRGILRATQANVAAGRVVQGGSTITQQLAKTSFLSLDRSFTRKAQEVIIAFWLEAWLTKEEILSRYLSSVYFGDGAYGLRAAAEQYFDKGPERLTIGEAAMLAGLVKAPSRLAPTRDYEGARARGRLVIAAMREQGLISEAQWRGARRAVLRPGRKGLPNGSYYADWAWPEAANSVPDTFGEVTIATTLDSRLQRLAERVVKRNLDRSGWHSVGQAALVAMRPDGRVVAMVGGKDYGTSVFNRAVQAKRQSGSAFKLFVYLAALRSGMDVDSEIEDAPVTIGDWSPKNNDNKYRGPITLKRAFALSSNVAAARLANTVGTGAIREAARDLGIRDEIGDDLTISLGTSTMSLLDLTAAYAAVAGGTQPVTPYAVTAPAPREGVMARLRALGGEAFPERAALREMMRATIDYGTGTRAKLPIAAFGKTGTTQDSRDAIFVGFAGDLVVGIWVGNDDNSPMKGVLGSTMPATMWREFMMEALPEVREIVQREAEEERARDAEDAAAQVDLSVLLGPDVDAVLRGERLDVARASALLSQLANVIANTPADAEGVRQAAETLSGRIRDAIAAGTAAAEGTTDEPAAP